MSKVQHAGARKLVPKIWSAARNKLGFDKGSGERYIETHHVISLASSGQDRVTNVLAVCPEDHRKAHFGKDRDTINAEMLTILKRLNP